MIFLALNLSDSAFFQLINVKMPTIVGIFTFMSRINVLLSSIKHEKSLKTSVTGLKMFYIFTSVYNILRLTVFGYLKSGPQVIKLFMLNSTEQKF